MSIKNKIISKIMNIRNYKKFLYFAVIGGFGTILNTAILYALTSYGGMNYIIASIIATEAAIISNFIGNNYITFRNKNRNASVSKKFLSFQLISLVTLSGTIFFLWLFVTLFGKNLLIVWNVLAILIMFLANFILNSSYTWKTKIANVNREKASKRRNVGGLLILFLLCLLIQTAHPTIAVDLMNISSTNITMSSNTTDPTAMITTSLTTDLNATSATVNQTSINMMTNITTGNQTSDPTINTTASQTVNQTSIVTANITTNQTINTTANQIINITTNQTGNQTINRAFTFILAANTTINQTTNTTTNQTVNQTSIVIANVTTNQTISNTNSSIGDIVAVSGVGYHPLSIKQVVVYTSNQNGIFNIRDSGTNAIIASSQLQRPKSYSGSIVNCQGNMPCLVGDFTNFTTTGNFYIEENGINSRTFTISPNIFSNTIPIYFEFFNAQLQQGSSYHADMHSGYSPPFTSMADGSFIMEADQAALPLIRLGSAYRRDPQLFQFDNYNILASGKPDIEEYMMKYVQYLEGLQGVAVSVGNGPNAARLGSGMVINNVFVPGPTNLTSINVYIPGSPPTLLQQAPVVSLCGNSSNPNYQQCINDAALYYKCQADEPCLNVTYNDRFGTIQSNINGYAVSKGWGYEFGCYFDVNLNSGVFNNGQTNPCQIFYNDTSRMYTSMTLLAFLEALPAINDFSTTAGTELLNRSINTYHYIVNNYPAFTSSDADSGFFGASQFLLYDYTNDSNYLQTAYKARGTVGTTFISDATHGNEFYWEEYIRHKNNIIASGLAYQYNGQNPEELFRGKIFGDYKDSGPTSISNNGERVFQFDPNIQFQNSRYILTEGLLAQKTSDFLPGTDSFIPVVAQNQLAWLTGMNAVQQGISSSNPVKSMSFIFGIGDFPKQFHSRWLVDTGYSTASGGNIVGARGTGYQFYDNASNSYQYLDGVTTINGVNLGALGNSWHNEISNSIFVTGKTFNNGKAYIPGWINGPYDTIYDNDVIFNYNDNINNYEFTETTNEIVATAVEYYAYLDGNLNNRSRYVGNVVFPIINNTNGTNSTNSNSTNSNSTGNSTNSNQNSTLLIITNPGSVNIVLNLLNSTTSSNASIIVNPVANITTDINGQALLSNMLPGSYNITASKTNYSAAFTPMILLSGNNSLNITLIPLAPSNSTNITGNATNNTTNNNITINNSLSIIGKGSGLKVISTVNGTNLYYMREDFNTTFFVLFNTSNNSSNSVTWYVDGVMQNIVTAQNATFFWNPGILWVPRAPDLSNNTAISTITAVTANDTITWNVAVQDVINPFFSSSNDAGDVLGSADTKVHVFTNNNIVNFTGVNVTIISSSGNLVYQLSPQYSTANETDWSVYISDTTPGDNYLRQIVGFNNATGINSTYDIAGTSRSHYRTIPSSGNTGGNNNGNNGGGGGGGGSVSASLTPELIYVTLEKDVVTVDQTQTITLDAKNSIGGIGTVQAELLTPDGRTRELQLALVNGTAYYGTWSTTFSDFMQGQYSISSIVLNSNSQIHPTVVNVTGRSFYYTNQTSITNANLNLIYSILDQDTVKNGTTVTLTLDAADSVGITSASAYINGASGAFSIPLTLTNGNKKYGTWKGTFLAARPGTTYSVKNITLSNAKEDHTYPIVGRSVYVTAIPGQNSALAASGQNSLLAITGNSILSPFSKEEISTYLKSPFAPTIIGFILMAIVAGAIILISRKP